MSILYAQIRTVDINGQPTSTVLAISSPIQVSEITRDTFYSFVFPTPVTVTPETQEYAVVLVRDDNYYYIDDNVTVGWVYSNSSNPYPDGVKWKYNGASWIESSDLDQYFKVFYSAPQTATTVEHIWNFNQDYGRQFFVSTDNTMELDMRFHLSFCIDGSGSMNWADINTLRTSETLLFIREIMRRSPFSYVDIWTFDNYITESTYDGPTNTRQIYSAALGSINSDGIQSRLWAASEQAIGNLDPASAVDSIIKNSYVDTVLDLMRQMNRIDYDAMHDIDNSYDPATGFAGISQYGTIVDYIINDYASTMGGIGIIMSDGYDNDTNMDYDIEDIIITANAIREELWTPVHCFALGSNYKNEQMYQISTETGGILYQLGQEVDTRLRESFNELLNDKDKTMFQGVYVDEVWFEELTFLSAIELGAIIPVTTDLKFEISLSYDGLIFNDWEEVPSNLLYSLEKFVMAFKIRITGWMGNIYGGNYYDIYGLVENDPSIQDEFTILCRYADYYGYNNYQYYTSTDDYYYYRSTDYPSPKVYSLRYWTVDPSITYKFTEPQTAPVISEYLFSPNVELPENTIMNWGIVRGDSTDPDDLVPIMNNRMGILPNRKMSLYYIPDFHQIGLSTLPASQTTNGIIIHRVVNASGTTVVWETTDIVVVKINGYEVDVETTPYQLVPTQGLIQWFTAPRPSTDIVTVDITTPGSSHLREGELAVSDNRRMYYATNGAWPWDAIVTVRVNDSIRSSGFSIYAEEGAILFFKELEPADIVTVEIQHAETYRIGYELKNYVDAPIEDYDFSFMFSKEAETETLLNTSLTAPPIALNVSLTPLTPSLTDRIVLNYEFSQIDNNAEMGTTIEWYVRRYGQSTFTHYVAYDNRNVMRTSDVPADNPGGPFQEYDSWYVVVTPKDINNTGIPVLSNTITIGEYIPPYISSATIIATVDGEALVRDDNAVLNSIEQALVASYVYYDTNTGNSDSDNSTIAWYKNGDSVASFESSFPEVTLPASYVKAGQVWHYIVTPYDDHNYGYMVESEEVIITQERN